MPKQYPPRNLRQGIIKFENPLPRYASGQKSVTDGLTGFKRMDNAKTISSPDLSAGDNNNFTLPYLTQCYILIVFLEM